ncbi:protein of unknown function [Cupriavidus taiwanensis]|uniref:Uncharacterized protein n=1 Tax=Cupriavidus taiwanensis TaxID=164546 RepID=A0A375IH11_9BURK|nr:hypothetical protein CBM2588_A80059 [Cupriavidus taiwanensis]SOZ26644.1 hypothetical protein CBM2608_A90056 [Cupriavidus taiwanensis]SPA25445.1 hypothetical protein CBM2623_A100055 [Cupriavidus taiwanensis]SPA43857.1 hypothetical protein CBM2629_A100055 [Cupriavidus taiwanensis]SPK72505.1 protein of unknown function [Cupriavidus taiwanensis]
MRAGEEPGKVKYLDAVENPFGHGLPFACLDASKV